MALDYQSIIERRKLRRKLTFWRIVAALAAVAVIGAVIRLAGFGPDYTSRITPHIARVEISGIIREDDDLLQRLEDIAEDDSVKALVLEINSPGGTTYGGETIFRAVRKVAEVKPVVAEVHTLAASAGYMIASAADYIVAGDTSIVGSIGVIFQYGQISELLDKIGVSVDAIKSAPLKAEPSPFHPTSPEAEAMIRAMVVDSFDWFVDLVAERRDMSREDVLAVADGSIFTGRQALEHRLVDAIGGQAVTRAWLEEEGGIAPGLEFIEWKARDSGFLFAEALAAAAGLVLGDLDWAESALRHLTSETLLLDGLTSVWQFSAAQNSEGEAQLP